MHASTRVLDVIGGEALIVIDLSIMARLLSSFNLFTVGASFIPLFYSVCHILLNSQYKWDKLLFAAYFPTSFFRLLFFQFHGFSRLKLFFNVLGPTPLWFVQKLDHAGNSTATWKQKYFVNSTFYNPGGPLFCMIPFLIPFNICNILRILFE
jgi:hypothetical protein